MKLKVILLSGVTAIALASASGVTYIQAQSTHHKAVQAKALKVEQTKAKAQKLAAKTSDAKKQDDTQNNAQDQKQEQTQTAAQTQPETATNTQADTEKLAATDASATATQTQPTSAVNTSPAPNAAAPKATRTDGFNFLGKHWDITTFSNTSGGNTPRWTPYIFQWSAIPNYYLAEAASSAGSAVRQLSVGDEVVVNGQTYHVTDIRHGMKRLDSLETVENLTSTHAMGLQTCDDATGTYISTYWFD
ncbi:hypothetical protein [Fructobacillus durionis]|uniref:Uncharacterized protein n=1 Tax=Fructobacillus durionis TaxID=283737 RepID=A0A1I1FJN9_9LACO|nr:hypothetical protein [Fructobacillus durionis]SFB99202.1 hypothetical protein SAMN05660453_0774 [Fructobacillus durionis]